MVSWLGRQKRLKEKKGCGEKKPEEKEWKGWPYLPIGPR